MEQSGTLFLFGVKGRLKSKLQQFRPVELILYVDLLQEHKADQHAGQEEEEGCEMKGL